MHVEPEHRKLQAAIVPPDIRVRYVIIDRPLEEKQRDAGWRKEKGLVEKYDRMFADQVTTALSGDDGPNVEIVDLRGQLTRSGMQQLDDLYVTSNVVASSRSSSSKGRSS